MSSLLNERAHQLSEKAKFEAAIHGAEIKEQKEDLTAKYTQEDYENMSQEQLDAVSEKMRMNAMGMLKDFNK